MSKYRNCHFLAHVPKLFQNVSRETNKSPVNRAFDMVEARRIENHFLQLPLIRKTCETTALQATGAMFLIVTFGAYAFYCSKNCSKISVGPGKKKQNIDIRKAALDARLFKQTDIIQTPV